MITPVFVIAEAGVNHNGSLELAVRLVEAAHAAGADAVKFQTFRSEAVISRHALKAAYQVDATGAAESQLEMVKKLELDAEAHRRLQAHCEGLGIQFLSTPFDSESLDFLVQRMNVPRLKIASGEITNGPFLLRAARTQRPIILSTGMSNLGEVEMALGVLAFGYLATAGAPCLKAFRTAYCSESGQQVLRERVVLLHCTTEYPAPYPAVNLRAMDTLAQAFGLPVGYSDHTLGIAVALGAVARGACIVEKHFTLDRDLPGPDHRASLQPDEFAAMVRGIRVLEVALGRSGKFESEVEVGNRDVARKSLVAARPIAAGERFSAENLTAKRPGHGTSPMSYWELLGRRAPRPFAADDLVEWDAD